MSGSTLRGVVLGRVLCLLVGHRWEYALTAFGRMLYRCERCGALRLR